MKDYFFGREFESVKDVTDFVRQKIRSYDSVTYIGEDHKDFAFFRELYLRFNSNKNIEGFLLEQNPTYRSKYFDYLSVCLLGRWSCFSWINCCKRKQKGFFERLTDAMRREIEYEVFNFKKKYPPSCAVCAVIGNCEVDHIKEFSTIRDEYLAIAGKPSIEFKDNVIGVVLPDGEFKEGWRKYHKENATYQFLCKFHHSKKTAKFCGYNI